MGGVRFLVPTLPEGTRSWRHLLSGRSELNVVSHSRGEIIERKDDGPGAIED